MRRCKFFKNDAHKNSGNGASDGIFHQLGTTVMIYPNNNPMLISSAIIEDTDGTLHNIPVAYVQFTQPDFLVAPLITDMDTYIDSIGVVVANLVGIMKFWKQKQSKQRGNVSDEADKGMTMNIEVVKGQILFWQGACEELMAMTEQAIAEREESVG